MVSRTRGSDVSSESAVEQELVPIDARLIASIDHLVGPEGRAEFVRTVLEAGVRRVRRLHDAIDALQGATIPEWETPESTQAWIDEIRGRAPRNGDIDTPSSPAVNVRT